MGWIRTREIADAPHARENRMRWPSVLAISQNESRSLLDHLVLLPPPLSRRGTPAACSSRRSLHPPEWCKRRSIRKVWVGGEIFRSQTHLTTLAKMGYLESAICSDLSILSFDLIGSDLLSFFNPFFNVKSISRDPSRRAPWSWV